MFDVEWEGLNEALDQLGRYVDRIDQAVAKALYVEGEQLMADAKKLTPVDEGVLRASGFVTLPFEDPEDGSQTVDVGFGGPAGSGNQNGETNRKPVGYAIIQHEDLTLNHKVGQAKFLEEPLNTRKGDYAKRLSRRILANL